MASKRILWVDDDIPANEVDALAADLKACGAGAVDVDLVNDASSSLTKALSRSYDAIVMDLQFGNQEFDGLHMLTLLSSQTATPVIVYSAHKKEHDATLRELRNVVRVVEKPASRELAEVLAKVLSNAPPVIVHLSDIHFGEAHGHGGRTYTFQTLRQSFEREVADFLLPRRPNMIIVSGDLTTTGTRAEFKDACAFLEWLRKALSLDAEAVYLVPGNHDVNLAEDVNYSFLNYWSDLLLPFYGSSSSVLSQHVAAMDPGEPPQQDHLSWVRSGPGVQASVAGFVSTGVTADPEMAIKGYARGTQATVVRNQLESVGAALTRTDPGALRIAVLHHHLFPVPSNELVERGTRDDDFVVYGQALFFKWLADHNVRVVLHGHTHYPSMRTVQVHFTAGKKVKPVPIHVLAGGTLGASSHATAVPYHHYYLLTVQKDGLELEVKSRIRTRDDYPWRDDPEMSTTVALR